MIKEGLALLGRSRTARKLVTGTPLRGMSRRFVPGEGVEDLLRAIGEANAAGMAATGNYLGEEVQDEAAARSAADVYVESLDRIHAGELDANVSVKLTQLGQDISGRTLLRNVQPVLERARATGNFVRFDMEASAYVPRTLDTFERLWAEGWRNIGVVLQAYLHRTAGDLARMNELGARVRLCKGAYVEPEEIAFQRSEEIEGSFVSLMRTLLDRGSQPAIATHDERLIDETLQHVSKQGLGPERFELQLLHGVRRDLQRELVEDGYRVRVYIPFGDQWYPYLMRRLAEQPSNFLFLAGSVVRESPLGVLMPKRRGAGNLGGDGR